MFWGGRIFYALSVIYTLVNKMRNELIIEFSKNSFRQWQSREVVSAIGGQLSPLYFSEIFKVIWNK